MTPSVIVTPVIRSFRSPLAERIWRGEPVRHWAPDLQQVARRKLRMLNNAQSLKDLWIPPGNRLEALQGDREGQFSIRINDRWRICFKWEGSDVQDVEIVDYH